MTAFEKRNWTAADAPVLAGEPGNLVFLLKKVFVDGYGSGDQSTPPLPGWEMKISSDGLKCALRSTHQHSPGYWFHIDDSDPRTAYAHGGQEFTEWDSDGEWDLTAQFPTSAEDPVRIVKSETADSTSRMWTFIADERTIYMSLCRVSDGYEYSEGRPRFALYAIGDVQAHDPLFEDKACMLVGYGDDSPDDGNFMGSSGSRLGWLNFRMDESDARNHGRLASAPEGEPSGAFRSAVFDDAMTVGPGYGSIDSAIDWGLENEIYLAPIILSSLDRRGVFMGQARGLRAPIVNAGTKESAELLMGQPPPSDQDPVVTREINGDHYFAMPYSVTGEDLGVLFIKVTD